MTPKNVRNVGAIDARLPREHDEREQFEDHGPRESMLDPIQSQFRLTKQMQLRAGHTGILMNNPSPVEAPSASTAHLRRNCRHLRGIYGQKFVDWGGLA
jgi:hypothetical protein